MEDARYSTRRWARLREVVFERDGRVCKINGPHCTGRATQIDHIIAVNDGGPFWDAENLRPACANCNSGRAQRQKEDDGWRRSRTQITLVVGPPGACAEMAALIHERKGPHDLVIDYAAMADAMGGATHEDIMAVRNSLLRRVRRGETSVPRVWIQSTNPRAEVRFPYHEVVEVDPGRDVVMGWHPGLAVVIDDWYRVRAPVTRQEW